MGRQGLSGELTGNNADGRAVVPSFAIQRAYVRQIARGVDEMGDTRAHINGGMSRVT
jgi:hypothetical protein